MRKKSIPDFKTEEEELIFWDTHRIQDYDDGPADDIIWDIRPRRKTRVTVRLEPHLAVRLRGIARKYHMRYQTLARGLADLGAIELEEAAESDD